MDEFANRRYPVDEHFRFQRRTWLVERVGWCALAAIPLLALTGLFGGGGELAKHRIEAGSVTVAYQRFERRTRLTRFVFNLAPGAAEHRLHFDRTFQKNYEITGVVPSPAASGADTDGVALSFAPSPAQSAIVVWAHPHGYGFHRLRVGADGTPVELPVLIYP